MAFRSSTLTQITNGSGTVLTGSLPAGTAAGDRLLAFITQDVNGHTITAATGWETSPIASADQAGPNGQTVKVFEKKSATGSDAVNFTSSDSRRATVIIMAFSGRDNSAAATVSTPTVDINTNASPISVALTGLTAATGDDIAWFAQLDQISAGDTWGFSSLSGFTEREDASNGDWLTAAAYSKDNSASGATGTLTATATQVSGFAGAGWSGVVIALPKAPGHKFWRINISDTDSIDDYFAGLSEMQLQTSLGGADLCTGGTATASSHHAAGGRLPSAAFDDALGTLWISDQFLPGPQWLAYELVTPANITHFTITAASGTTERPLRAPKDFTLEYSDNGSSWTVAQTYVGEPTWTADEQRAFAVATTTRPSAVTPGTWTDEAGGTLVVADINDASDATGARDPAGATYPVLPFTMDTPMAASVAHTCYFRGMDLTAGKQVRQVLFADDGTTVVATGAWHTMTGTLATYSDVLTPSSDAYKGEIQTQSA